MNQKSTRGVQQEEVSAAADALLAESLRPTIERIRLKIGRGSPNTVAPMLEAWFATLGARLGVVPSQEGEDRSPTVVRKAMASVWAAALAAGREQADLAVAAQRDALAQDQAALAAERQELARREAVIAERASALEERLAAANRQASEQAERMRTLQADLEGCKAELTATRTSLAGVVLARDDDRRRFDEQLVSQIEDRRRIEERGQNGACSPRSIGQGKRPSSTAWPWSRRSASTKMRIRHCSRAARR